jgi:hypothetical protein
MRYFFSLLLVLGALAVLGVSGCTPEDTKKSSTSGPKGQEVLLLEVEEIDLIPGAEKQVKVKTGKAETVEAPKDSGVTAKAEGDKLTISAGKDAKEGTHRVTVKGGQGKDTTLKVNVKKGAGK